MPLFFAGQITNTESLLNATIAFIAFSFTAGGIYIINDYKDIEDDQKHPKNKSRPLAQGNISIRSAIFFMGILIVAAITLLTTLPLKAFVILSTYFVLNICYSYFFKHIPILDITIIAIGLVLRLFLGSVVTDITLSVWIVLMTFLLALFISLAKRRDDVLNLLSTGKKLRKVVEGYNLKFIDGAMMIMASALIITYILYTTSKDVMQRMVSENLYLTTIFVILGVMRYLQISFVENDSGSPIKIIFKDKFTQLTLLAWVSTFTWIIYF